MRSDLSSGPGDDETVIRFIYSSVCEARDPRLVTSPHAGLEKYEDAYATKTHTSFFIIVESEFIASFRDTSTPFYRFMIMLAHVPVP